MNIILLEKVGRLGELGSQVNVRRGYARNYLLPRGLAIRATPGNLAQFAERRAELEQEAAKKLKVAQERANVLTGLVVQLKARATEEGRLYGSIGVFDIIKALASLGHKLEKREIQLPPEPIRQLGEYDITAQFHLDVSVSLKVAILPN